MVGVTYNAIAERLNILDTFAQLLLATKRRLNRKNGRIATIVSLVVPSHETKLCRLNALTLQLIGNLHNLLESYRHTHLRLILQSLVLNRSWNRLPALANTNFGSCSGVSEVLILLYTLLQHLRHMAILDKIVAITASHCAIIRTLHRIEIYNKRLVCATLREVVLIRKPILSLLVVIDLHTLETQTFEDC